MGDARDFPALSQGHHDAPNNERRDKMESINQTENPVTNVTNAETSEPKEVLTIQVAKPKKKVLIGITVVVIAAIILALNMKHCFICDKLVLFPHKISYLDAYVCNEHWSHYKKSQEATLQMYDSIIDGVTNKYSDLLDEYSNLFGE